MSADNFSMCPKCGIKKEDELQRINSTLYGKVKPEAYREAIEKVMEKGDKKDLREGYEFYVEGKVLSVSYGAKCSKCNFEFYYDAKIDMLTGKKL
jgi:predicted nucleic-acid-binding Zn-ribbon protein